MFVGMYWDVLGYGDPFLLHTLADLGRLNAMKSKDVKTQNMLMDKNGTGKATRTGRTGRLDIAGTEMPETHGVVLPSGKLRVCY